MKEHVRRMDSGMDIPWNADIVCIFIPTESIEFFLFCIRNLLSSSN